MKGFVPFTSTPFKLNSLFTNTTEILTALEVMIGEDLQKFSGGHILRTIAEWQCLQTTVFMQDGATPHI
ncbi:unnamed protein product [Larinioides sclopetarius]|uniref:Uncharacterized protein n=1 Tax=Larinioides sclopetarius TaxID=280406 RepID=A0AAV2BK42_9ARAC